MFFDLIDLGGFILLCAISLFILTGTVVGAISLIKWAFGYYEC